MTDSLKRLIKAIKKSKRIIIATHIDPDCDGICSVLLMAHLISLFKKPKFSLFCHSPIPKKYQFLLKNFQFSNSLKRFDLLIVVDSAGLDRILPQVKYKTDFLKGKFIINIDHHPSNREFGNVTIIDVKASSTCEIIYKIFKKLGLNINQDLAEIFYAGIYNETGGFVYPNTTAEALHICSELVNCGIEPAGLVKKLNAKTVAGTKLLSDVLTTIEIKNGIGTMFLTQKILKKHHAQMSESENFISFLQAIQGVRVSVFFREEKDCIRISLRSDGVLDVNDFARKFGGGGHRLAAGIRLNESLFSVKKKILTALAAELKNAGYRE